MSILFAVQSIVEQSFTEKKTVFIVAYCVQLKGQLTCIEDEWRTVSWLPQQIWRRLALRPAYDFQDKSGFLT